MGRMDYRMATLLLLAGSISFGCAKANDENNTVASDSAAMAPAPAPAAPAAATPTDPQIAHIAVTANTIDADMGKLAKQKSKTKDVTDFAQTMITDHTAVNDKANALVKKLNVTPEDNPTSQSLNSDAQTVKQQLQGMDGAAFDKAYIDHEVTYHQQVLDALDKTLVPNAQNAELKDLLTQARAAVAAHLQRAQQIQQTLNK